MVELSTVNRRNVMRIWIAVPLALLVSGLVQADNIQSEMEKLGIDPNVSYSGTRHIEAKEGTFDAFVRRAPKKMRMKMNMGGFSGIVITREDLGLTYTLMPEMKMYREAKGAEAMAGGDDLKFSAVSKLGREEISGYDCTKYRAKFTDAKGGKAGGYYWVSDDGILMKIDMIYQSRGRKGERMALTLRDLEIGEQDPNFFEVPGNYQKFGFGAGMSGQFGAQNSQYPGYEDPTLGEEVEEAAKDEAEKAVVDETRKKVRKGLGKLFGN
jgi:hypothetical protein